MKRTLAVAAAIVGTLGVAGAVLSRRMRREEAAAPGEGEIDVRAVFGGVERAMAVDGLREGSIVATCAGVDLDLRETTIAAEGAHLRIEATCAGVEILLPANCRVELHDRAFMGSTELVAADDDPGPAAPVLRIDARAIMSGIEMMQDPPWPLAEPGWPFDDAPDETEEIEGVPRD